MKHVSGATQGDDVAAVLSENGMVLGGKPDPDLPVDIGFVEGGGREGGREGREGGREGFVLCILYLFCCCD